jgi:hypothetical protein
MSLVDDEPKGPLATEPTEIIERLKSDIKLGVENGERLRYFVERLGNSSFSLTRSNGLVVVSDYLDAQTIFGPTFWVFDRILDTFADASLQGIYLTPAIFRATELSSGRPTPYVRYLLSTIACWEAQFYQHSSLQNPLWRWLPRKYAVLIGDLKVSDELAELASIFPYSLEFLPIGLMLDSALIPERPFFQMSPIARSRFEAAIYEVRSVADLSARARDLVAEEWLADNIDSPAEYLVSWIIGEAIGEFNLETFFGMPRTTLEQIGFPKDFCELRNVESLRYRILDHFFHYRGREWNR